MSKTKLSPRVYPTPINRVQFDATPQRRPDYVPVATVPMRAGSMDAYKLPSIEFGKRKFA